MTTIAACLFVKNGARSLERAIGSVRAHVDEVCVYDTGSTDGTLALLDRLAQQPGAPVRVERGEWRDSFAYAREQSFDMASSTWALALDDDEALVHGEALARVIASSASTDYVWISRTTGDRGGWLKRLIRRGTGRSDGVAHDEWLPNDETRTAVVSPKLLSIAHEPFAAVGRHDYLDSALEATAQRDARPWTLVVAAIECAGRGNVGKAFELLDRYLSATEGACTDERLYALQLAGELDTHDREAAEWTERIRRGEPLDGLARLGPWWMQRVIDQLAAGRTMIWRPGMDAPDFDTAKAQIAAVIDAPAALRPA